MLSISTITVSAYADKRIKVQAIGMYSKEIPTGLIKIVSKPNSRALFIPPGGCVFSTSTRTFTQNSKAVGGMQCGKNATLSQYSGTEFIIGFLRSSGGEGQMCYTSYKLSSQGFSGTPYHFKYNPNENLTVLVSAHKRPEKYANSYPFKYILMCKGV